MKSVFGHSKEICAINLNYPTNLKATSLLQASKFVCKRKHRPIQLCFVNWRFYSDVPVIASLVLQSGSRNKLLRRANS